jgi:hypothetical protein
VAKPERTIRLVIAPKIDGLAGETPQNLARQQPSQSEVREYSETGPERVQPPQQSRAKGYSSSTYCV